MPTIPGIRQFSRCCSRTSAYETHCRATGRWLGLLCFYTSLVISFSFSLSNRLFSIVVPFEALSRAELNLLTHMAPLAPPLRQFSFSLQKSVLLVPFSCFSSSFKPRCFCIVFHLFISPVTVVYLFILLPLPPVIFSRNFSIAPFNLLALCLGPSPHYFPTAVSADITSYIGPAKRLPVLRQELFSTARKEKKKKENVAFSEERLAGILRVETTFESVR